MLIEKGALISCDIDDVLKDHHAKLLEWHNTTFGTSLVREDMKNFNLWEMWGGTKEESIEKLHVFGQSPYYGEIEPVPGAQHAVAKLKEDFRLVAITSRDRAREQQTRQAIRRCFPGGFQEIYFSGHKSYGGGKTKAELCVELGVSMHIDDGYEYACQCAATGVLVLLWDTPWNQFELPANVIRVHSWDEILKVIYSGHAHRPHAA